MEIIVLLITWWIIRALRHAVAAQSTLMLTVTIREARDDGDDRRPPDPEPKAGPRHEPEVRAANRKAKERTQ